MGRNKKSLSGAVTPPGAGKKAVLQSDTSDRDARVSWRIGYLDHDHPDWGWSRLDPAALAELREKLSHYEDSRMTEFFSPIGRAKPVGVDAISPAAQKRLLELERDDQDELWEIRLSARARVWGLRRGPVFHLLWWDPEHTVCPSRKRHT